MQALQSAIATRPKEAYLLQLNYTYIGTPAQPNDLPEPIIRVSRTIPREFFELTTHFPCGKELKFEDFYRKIEILCRSYVDDARWYDWAACLLWLCEGQRYSPFEGRAELLLRNPHIAERYVQWQQAQQSGVYVDVCTLYIWRY